jgi:hypothetical protein
MDPRKYSKNLKEENPIAIIEPFSLGPRPSLFFINKA